MAVSQLDFVCPVESCGFRSARSFSEILAHIKGHHFEDVCFKCHYESAGSQECSSMLSTWKSYEMHVRRYHAAVVKSSEDAGVLYNSQSQTIQEDFTENICESGDSKSTVCGDPNIDIFYIKLREHYSLPIVTAKAITNDFLKFNEAVQAAEAPSSSRLNSRWTSLQSEACYIKLLRAKGLVEPKETILFQSIVCHTRYPTRDEYSTVLNLLMSKYPALKDRYSPRSGLKHASWLQSLRNRFKEHRRSLTDDPMHELMQKRYGGKKKRKPSSGSDVPFSIRCKKLRTSVYSIAEHLESSDTEDEFSMKIHLQAMKDALKRNHLDARLLSDRMSRTFMYRRKAILSGKSTEKILEDYPCFRFPEWILEEMIRIVKVDLMDVLGKLDPAKMKKIETLGLEKWSKMTLRTKSLIDCDEVCWILVLHDLTNTSGFVYEKNPATPYPAIIFDESDLLIVTVDNQTTGNISSFFCAICCVLALYWVLNIDFPSSQKKFPTFLAKYVFGIPGIDYMPSLMGIMNSL